MILEITSDGKLGTRGGEFHPSLTVGAGHPTRDNHHDHDLPSNWTSWILHHSINSCLYCCFCCCKDRFSLRRCQGEFIISTFDFSIISNQTFVGQTHPFKKPSMIILISIRALTQQLLQVLQSLSCPICFNQPCFPFSPSGCWLAASGRFSPTSPSTHSGLYMEK